MEAAGKGIEKNRDFSSKTDEDGDFGTIQLWLVIQPGHKL